MTKTDTCRNAGGRGTPDANVRVVFPTTYQVYFSGAEMSQSVTHAMTVDVEDYFHVAAFFDVIQPQDWDRWPSRDRKSTRLNSSHVANSYAVFCLKKKI